MLVILLGIVVASLLAVGYVHWHTETSSATAELPPAPPPAPPSAPTQISTVFIGDSVTQANSPGFDSPPGDLSWVSYVIDVRRSPWLYNANVAVQGDQTPGMLARFRRDVLSRKPEAVVMLVGTNDIGAHLTWDESRSNIARMIELAHQSGAQTWLISSPPRNDFPEEANVFRANERAWARSLPPWAHFIDVSDSVMTTEGKYRPGYTMDGIHFTQKAARVFADAILEKVAPEAARLRAAAKR